MPDAYRINGQENCRRILSICKKLDLPVLLSSDSHGKKNIGNMQYIFPLLEELDFPAHLVINSDLSVLSEIIRQLFLLYISFFRPVKKIHFVTAKRSIAYHCPQSFCDTPLIFGINLEEINRHCVSNTKGFIFFRFTIQYLIRLLILDHLHHFF